MQHLIPSGIRAPLEYCKQLFNFDFRSVSHFYLEFTIESAEEYCTYCLHPICFPG